MPTYLPLCQAWVKVISVFSAHLSMKCRVRVCDPSPASISVVFLSAHICLQLINVLYAKLFLTNHRCYCFEIHTLLGHYLMTLQEKSHNYTPDKRSLKAPFGLLVHAIFLVWSITLKLLDVIL